MLSSFVLPDRRLVTTDKQIYKLVIRNKGPISLTADVLDRELEQLIRAAIPQLHHKVKLKLQTEHLLAQCSLSVWQIPVTIGFKRQKQVLEKFQNVVNITVKEKNISAEQQLATTDTTDITDARVRHQHNSGRRNAVQQRKRSRSPNITGTHRLRENTSDNRQADSTSSSSSSLTLSSQGRGVRNISVLPRNIRRPHCATSLLRDKTRIAEEDMQEDIKMHAMSEPESSAGPAMDVPQRSQGFIGSVIGMLLTPIKAVVGRK